MKTLQEIKHQKLIVALRKLSLVFINTLVFFTLAGSMWFMARFDFLSTVMDSLFILLAILLWMSGIIYAEAWKLCEVKQ